MIGFISDSMDGYLQTCLIGCRQSFLHDPFWEHIRYQQTSFRRIIRIRIKKKRCRGAQGPVHKTLESGNFQKVVSRKSSFFRFGQKIDRRNGNIHIQAGS